MAHTISGSLGPTGAGATVFFSSGVSFPQVGAAIIADASGNFTSSLLPDNASYNVTPVLFGAEFLPAVKVVALGIQNITGINWPGVDSYYKLVPNNSDSFNRGGVTQNPVQGWDAEIFSSWSPLQVVSDACRATTLNAGASSSAGLPQNYSPSADQYCQYDFVACTDLSQLGLLVVRRNLVHTQGVNLEWGGILNLPPSQPNGGGAVQITAFPAPGTVLFSSPGFIDFNVPAVAFNTGDTLLFVARGNNFYAFLKQAGNIIPMAGGSSAANPNANRPGIELSTVGNLANLQVKNWVAGNVVNDVRAVLAGDSSERPLPTTEYRYPARAVAPVAVPRQVTPIYTPYRGKNIFGR